MTRPDFAAQDIAHSQDGEQPAAGPELRRYFRMHFDEPAILHRSGARYAIRLRDISIGGAGIENAGHLRLGETVSILVGEAIRLNGIVVWCQDGRAGIRFHALN